MVDYQLFITKKLNNDIAEDEETAKAVYKALERFNAEDWGELPEEDKEANNEDLRNRTGRILAKYETPKGFIYISLTFEDPELKNNIAMLMYVNEY